VLHSALEDDGIEIVLSSTVSSVRPRRQRRRRHGRFAGAPRRQGPARLRRAPERRGAAPRRARDRARAAGHRRRRADAHLGRRDLGGRRRDRPLPVHADRPVPGADRGRRTCSVSKTRRGLLGAPTSILHEPELARVGPHRAERRARHRPRSSRTTSKHVQRSFYKEQSAASTRSSTRPAPGASSGLHVVARTGARSSRLLARPALWAPRSTTSPAMHPRFPTFVKASRPPRAGDAAAARDGRDLQLKRPYMCQVPPTRRPAGLDERTFSHAFRFVKGERCKRELFVFSLRLNR
jgi:hypothetical protein